MQSHMENFAKIHSQICFAYPSFHLCNIMVNFFFVAYVTFYLLDEESSIFFTRIVAKQFSVESCVFSFMKIIMVCMPEVFLRN